MNQRHGRPPITISVTNYDRLAWIATAGVHSRPNFDAARLLADELLRATAVPGQAMPPTVATMHSRIEFRDDGTGVVSRLTLVDPGEEDPEAGQHSVLTPLGAALIGLTEGQSIRWRTQKGGWRSLTLLRVIYQPERMALPGQHPTAP